MRLIDSDELKKWIFAEWLNQSPQTGYLRAMDILMEIDKMDEFEKDGKKKEDETN